MLQITLQGDRALIARLVAAPPRMRLALLRKITTLTFMLERRVKQKLSGPVLKVKTGALRSGIFSDVKDDGVSITGKVSAPKDVPYAAIHEFGGKTRAHDIYPKKGEALKFSMGGKTVFAKVVHHPGSVMPERSYLRSSLIEMKAEIIEGMTQAAKQAAK